MVQEEILGLTQQLLDIRRSPVRIDQVKLLDSVGQAVGKLPSLRSGQRVSGTAGGALIPRLVPGCDQGLEAAGQE
jgi:hypothetical protein